MQGQTSGGPRVFGYRVVDKHYVLDEGEAQVIRQIFTWYDQGKSMTEIVNQLNAQGAVNAAGKPFIISVMRRILTNKMYIGIRLYKGEDIGIRVRLSLIRNFLTVCKSKSKRTNAPLPETNR